MGIFAALVTSMLSAAPDAHHVVVIVTDGLRTQELFDGAERRLMGRAGGVENEQGLVDKYWRPSLEARRAALLPFIWGTVATKGQLFGNARLGSVVKVTNAKRLSYPGYNEMFTGVVDARIDSNAFADNPNVTVLEWLAQQPGFGGRVQAFATWETFFRIFNVTRSGLDVRAGWNPPFAGDADRTPAKDTIDAFYAGTTPFFGGNTLDAFTFLAVKESLKQRHPRVLFVGFGETDEWMHAGRYDMALEAARRVDRFIAELWSTLQAMPEYRGTTTLLITTDHGRGVGTTSWRHHQADVPGSDDVWFAAMGPGIHPLGERAAGRHTQGQLAATIAERLGFDWRAVRADAAPPLCFDAPPALTTTNGGSAIVTRAEPKALR